MANFPQGSPANSTIGASKLNLTMDQANAPALTPQQFYDKMLLELLRQTQFQFDRFAQKRQIGRNAGTNTINFRKIGKLAPALTPLTEGITPAGNTASKTNITGTVSQYGDWMAFSDVVDFREIDPIISEYTKELGYQAQETLDILAREILSAGTTVKYAQNYGTDGKTEPGTPVVTRGTVASKFSMRDIRKAVRDFRKNFVRPVYNGNYACFIGPDAEFDIFDDGSFNKYMDYAQTGKPMLDNEIGTLFGVTFFRVPNPKIIPAGTNGAPAGVDVHTAILIGSNAFGVVDVSGEGNVQSITKGLGSAGTEDPLNQRQSTGWKVNSFGAVRLEELAICRYEFAVTGL